LIETKELNVTATNVVCETKLSWEYYYCYTEVSYVYDNTTYKNKIGRKEIRVLKEGEEIKIEISKENPSFIIRPHMEYDKYKYSRFVILLFSILITLNNITLVYFVPLIYYYEDTKETKQTKETKELKKSN